MPTYEKELKRSKDGSITRYVGRNSIGMPEKFRLGYDLEAAQTRVLLILAIWEDIEDRTPPGQRSFWDAANLAAAKQIAKGEPAKLPKRDHEDPSKYVQRLQEIGKRGGGKFEPADPFIFDVGIDDLRNEVAQVRQQLSTALNVAKPTGVTLAVALDAYQDEVRKQNTLPTGSIHPWGKTQLDQLLSITKYLGDERFGGTDFTKLDLAEITYNRGDDIYGVFRKRPLTLRSKLGKRMTPSSAKNLIKTLGNFFDWLDGAERFEWTFPRRFHSISKTPDKPTPAELYDQRIAKQPSVIPDEHLKVLFEYALPIERLLLLLGLNCAFGASEIGQLRKEFVQLDASIIEGIRFKSGNETKHKLWQQSVIGLQWFMQQRANVVATKPEFREVIFLTERGLPLWHHTANGNSSDGISNIWYRLIERVRKDHSDFPAYSFNKLRKTSATRILKIASAEVASMILAHKTIGDDELLHHYALIPWDKLFEAQQQFERELLPILEAKGDEAPWSPKAKIYIGLSKAKAIIGLNASGVSAPQIAEQLGINVATVNRHLQAKRTKHRPAK